MDNWFKLIEESGLKKSHIAKHLKITPNMLSAFLYGRRNLSPEKIIQMRILLKQAIALKNKVY